MDDMTNDEVETGIGDALDQSMANVDKAPAPVELSEAEAGRAALKQRIRVSFEQATRDLDFATREIESIDRAIAMHQTNREGLIALQTYAKQRMAEARFQIARLVD